MGLAVETVETGAVDAVGEVMCGVLIIIITDGGLGLMVKSESRMIDHQTQDLVETKQMDVCEG